MLARHTQGVGVVTVPTPPSLSVQLEVLVQQAEARAADAKHLVSVARSALTLARELETVTCERDDLRTETERLQRLLDAPPDPRGNPD